MYTISTEKDTGRKPACESELSSTEMSFLHTALLMSHKHR